MNLKSVVLCDCNEWKNVEIHIIKANLSGQKQVFLFWLPNIYIICKPAHKLKLRKSFIFWVDAATKRRSFKIAYDEAA